MTQVVELQEERVEPEVAEGEETPEELEVLKGELEATHLALEERDERVATLDEAFVEVRALMERVPPGT